jgi:hypothetical protein
MATPTQGINPEVRQKFTQMREDIKKLTNTLQDVESQQSEYRYALSALSFPPFLNRAQKETFLKLLGNSMILVIFL